MLVRTPFLVSRKVAYDAEAIESPAASPRALLIMFICRTPLINQVSKSASQFDNLQSIRYSTIHQRQQGMLHLINGLALFCDTARPHNLNSFATFLVFLRCTLWSLRGYQTAEMACILLTYKTD